MTQSYKELRDSIPDRVPTPIECERIIAENPMHITRHLFVLGCVIALVFYALNKSEASARSEQGMANSFVQMFVHVGKNANVRQCPAKKCAVVRTAKENARFFVDELKQTDEWVPVYEVKKGGYVQYDSDKIQIGYVHQSLLVDKQGTGVKLKK